MTWDDGGTASRWLLAAALAGIALGCLVVVFVPAGLGWDFANYYDAGHKALVGETANLYDDKALIDGEPPLGEMLFMSAPISSYFYTGLALFEPSTALVLFKIQNAVALLLAIGILFFHFRPLTPAADRMTFAALFFTAALLFQPFWTVFRVGGQVTPTIMLCLALGLWLHSSKKFVLSALCFSIIVLMKPVFLPGAAFLAFASGPKFFLRAFLTGVAIAAFSVLVMGLDIHLEFVAKTREVAGILWPPHYNSSLTGWLAPLTAGCDGAGVCHEGLPGALASAIRLSAALGLVAAFVWMARSGVSERARLHLGWMIAAVLPMMITPVVWAHYLSVIFLPIAFVIAARRNFPIAAHWLVAALVLISIGQNLVFILAVVTWSGMDHVAEQIEVGLFKSLPLWLTLALFMFFRRSILAAYASSDFEAMDKTAALTGAAARIAADPRVRFLIAGGSLAALNWLLRFPLDFIMPYEVAVTASAIVLAVIGFFLYRSFVFQSSDSDLKRQIVTFASVGVAAVGVTAIVSSVARDMFVNASHLAAPDAEAFGHIYGIACAAVFNFLGHRYLTFRREKIA